MLCGRTLENVRRHEVSRGNTMLIEHSCALLVYKSMAPGEPGDIFRVILLNIRFLLLHLSHYAGEHVSLGLSVWQKGNEAGGNTWGISRSAQRMSWNGKVRIPVNPHTIHRDWPQPPFLFCAPILIPLSSCLIKK